MIGVDVCCWVVVRGFGVYYLLFMFSCLHSLLALVVAVVCLLACWLVCVLLVD